MRMRRLSRFRLLLIGDIWSFAVPLVILIPPFRIAFPLCLVFALIAGLAMRRAYQMSEALSRRQMRIRAVVALIGYPAWIIEIICVGIVFADPAVWALASVAIPLLCVFCYMSVRAKLGLEPNISGYT